MTLFDCCKKVKCFFQWRRSLVCNDQQYSDVIQYNIIYHFTVFQETNTDLLGLRYFLVVTHTTRQTTIIFSRKNSHFFYQTKSTLYLGMGNAINSIMFDLHKYRTLYYTCKHCSGILDAFNELYINIGLPETRVGNGTNTFTPM